MSSLTAQVNDKLYQARLLLEMLQPQEGGYPDGVTVRALESSVVLQMDIAKDLFITEVADSCQIKQPSLSLQQLSNCLASEGRSHAVVETLLVLAQDPQSWLSQLYAVVASVRQGHSVNKAMKTQVTGALVVTDVIERIDLSTLLLAFTDFTAEQRTYMSEW